MHANRLIHAAAIARLMMAAVLLWIPACNSAAMETPAKTRLDNLRRTANRIESLHEKKQPPGPHDWLAQLCPQCVQKVWWACSAKPAPRYQRLAEFAEKHHLPDEAKFWQRSRELVEASKERK